jgi:L-ascorbate metabolism protein UlaG (beta-lactamase superfamily)
MSQPLVEFVNHASFIVDACGVRLLSDPWIEGRVFNDGWELLAPTRMRWEDFASITHIWFSHEHPDHFFPPNVKRIDPAHRARIVVLYQTTADKKVVRFCRELGFKAVVELEPGKDLELAPGFTVRHRPLGTQWEGDSWLFIKTPAATILNINDCGVGAAEARAIAAEVGPVDLLATQFSYAAWQKNPEAVEFRRAVAQEMLDGVVAQVEELKPRWVLPFASFIWFCAEENFYLNRDANSVRATRDLLATKTNAEPVVLYPGDRWHPGAPWDSEVAIARWEAHTREIGDPEKRPRVKRPSIPAEELQTLARSFCERLRAVSNPFLVRTYLAYDSYQNERAFGVGSIRGTLRTLAGSVRPARVFCTDLGSLFTFSLAGALESAQGSANDADLQTTSAVLAFVFRFPWGGETLQINGCFRENPAWRDVKPWSFPNRLFIYTRLARRVDMGYRLTWRRVARALADRTFLRSLLPGREG